MPSNEDFNKLASDLRSLPEAHERIVHMIEHMRHEIDLARSDPSVMADRMHGLSQLLGVHADNLARSVLVDKPVDPPKLTLKGGKPQPGMTGL